MNYKQKAMAILKDESSSFWLQQSIRILDDKDVVDALNDIECLQELQMLRFEEAKKAWEMNK